MSATYSPRPEHAKSRGAASPEFLGDVMNWSSSFSRLVLVVLLGLFLASTEIAFAQNSKPADAPPHMAQSLPAHTPPTLPPTPDTSKPPAQPKTEQYTLSHDRYDKAIAYSRVGYTLYFVSSFLGILVLYLFLRLRVAARLRDTAENLTGNKWLQGLIFIPLLLGFAELFDLPIRVYWHSLSLRYEQSVQGWGSWLRDWALGEVLNIAAILLLVMIIFFLMRRSPRRWWFYSWLVVIPVLIFFFFLTPWFIDPLFNKFEPLDTNHPELVTAMEKVVQRTGLDIPRDRMFLMQASTKTNTLNAYVTGIGASKRVVVWDTTIQKTTTNETLFIFGHECGHYVLGHVRNFFLFFTVLLFVVFYLLFRCLHWSLDRWAVDWKILGAEDWASFAVLMLFLQIFMFVSSPLVNGFSRMQEHAADVFGLEVIHSIMPHSEEVAAHSFQVMGEVDLADPNPSPFITFWLYSHPPLAERLIFAHTYDPWGRGEPPKYIK
jgi:STE24 endopeptidase